MAFGLGAEGLDGHGQPKQRGTMIQQANLKRIRLEDVGDHDHLLPSVLDTASKPEAYTVRGTESPGGAT